MYWFDNQPPEKVMNVAKELNTAIDNYKTNRFTLDFFQYIAKILHDGKPIKDDEHTTTYSKWYCQYRFQKYKQVFVMNKFLYDRLIQTQGTNKLTFEVLEKLPYSDFYIDLSSCFKSDVHGAFISVEEFEVEKEPELRMNIILDIYNMLIPLTLDLLHDKSIPESISKNLTVENIDKKIIRFLIEIYSNIMMIILYLCCEKKDVVKLGTHKSNKAKRKNKIKKKETTINQVGYVIGKTYSNINVKYEYTNETETMPLETVTGSGTKKSPHFRQPHWQTYHVGKGRSESVLRWIDMIYVNGNEAEEKPVTVHKMK